MIYSSRASGGDVKNTTKNRSTGFRPFIYPDMVGQSGARFKVARRT